MENKPEQKIPVPFTIYVIVALAGAIGAGTLAYFKLLSNSSIDLLGWVVIAILLLWRHFVYPRRFSQSDSTGSQPPIQQ